MIILVKTPTVTFSLDINTADKVEVLIKKICERTSYSEFQFQLSFAGETLDYSTDIASYGIRKENTIHLQLIKELTFDVEYKTAIIKVTVPNSADLKILNLKSHICSVLKTNEPNIYSLPLVLSQGGKVFTDQELVHKVVKRMETLVFEQKSSGSGEGESSPDTQNLIPMINNEDILAHFAESAISNDVEIVFCFDTTTSMNAVIVEVRKKLLETVNRLMSEIPSIKIGVMALGDFCEERPLYILDLTNDVKKIVSFINAVKSTSGGDEPECYEYALHKAKFLSWSSYTTKAFVMIGDSPPHPPYYTPHHLNWVREADDLEALGVKIYGIVAIHEKYRYFYQTISERTGGLCILFSRFDLITEMFLAICFREASSAKYEQYKKEVKEKGGEGLDDIFADLDKPNFELTDAAATESSSVAPTEETTIPETSSTTTTETAATEKVEEEKPKTKEAAVKIAKKYGYISNYPDKSEEWCNFLDDDVKKTHSFAPGFFGGKYKAVKKASSYTPPIIGMVIGARHIGFHSFMKTLILKTLKVETHLYFNDYRLDTLKSIPFGSLFIATFSVVSKESFDQATEKIELVQKEHPTVQIYLLGLQSDLRKGTTTTSSVKPSPDTTSNEKESVTVSDSTTTTNTTTVTLVEKSDIDLLIRNKNLLGYSECSINDPSSITSLEKKILKLYEQNK